MRRFTCILLLLFGLVAAAGYPAQAQRGCPDPRALNYSPGAVVNDGSCQYAPAAASLLTRAVLPSELAETSGLSYSGQALWTLTDSGNPPVLYRLDPGTGGIRQRVRLSDFPNLDWEDLTADAQYLYVGDFGNNRGDRQDLRVLRVRRAAIGAAPAETVAAEAIAFRYPDQTSFAPGLNNHNFDCEALFYFNDSLHLFTKNWADLRTTYYTIPATPGTHVAHRKASFDVNGLLTGASLNAAGTEACLLGYNARTGATFVWLLSGFANGQFLGGNKRRVELPNALQIGQAEGIAFLDRYRLLVSNEQLAGPVSVPARLYELDASPWLAPPPPLPVGSAALSASLAVFPSPARRYLTVRRTAGTGQALALSLHDLRGQTLLTAVLPAGVAEQNISLASLAPGLYLLRAQSATARCARKLVVE